MAINVVYGNGGMALNLLARGVQQQAGQGYDAQFIGQVNDARQTLANTYANELQNATARDNIRTNANLQQQQLTQQAAEQKIHDDLAQQNAAADRAANAARMNLAQRDQSMQETVFSQNQSDAAKKRAAFATLSPDDQKRVMFGPTVFDPTKAPEEVQAKASMKAIDDQVALIHKRLGELQEKNPAYVADPIMRKAYGATDPNIANAAPTRIRPGSENEHKQLSDQLAQLMQQHSAIAGKITGNAPAGAALPGAAAAPRATSGVAIAVNDKILSIPAPPPELAAPQPGAPLRGAPQQLQGLKDYYLGQLKNQDPTLAQRLANGTATKADYQSMDLGFVKLARGQGWSL